MLWVNLLTDDEHAAFEKSTKQFLIEAGDVMRPDFPLPATSG